MLSEEYASELRAKIFDYQTFLDPLHYGAVYSKTPDSGTAHISIIGLNGDAVSLTTTISSAYVNKSRPSILLILVTSLYTLYIFVA